MGEKQNWQSIGIGMFVGFILTLAFQWYMNRHSSSSDWCANLPAEKSDLCISLHNQSIDYQKNMQENYGNPNEGVEDDNGFR